MIDQQAASKELPRAPPDWLHFPFRRLLGSHTLERRTAQAVWFSVPIQFYVLTQIPGGLPDFHPVAVVLVALLTVIAVLLISVIIAVFKLPPGSSFADRVQGWSVSLLINWVGAIVLLALGYLFSRAPNDDVVHALLADQLRGITFGDYPHILDPATFVVYLVYSIVALVVIRVLVGCYTERARSDQKPQVEPNMAFMVPLTALVMMLLNGATKLH